MKNYDEFHDGSLDELLIEKGTVHVFLSTEAKQLFVAVVQGVVALTAGGFKPGNIIFEVVARRNDELTHQDIAELYGLPAGNDGEIKAQMLLQEALERNLTILEINPSYGANCLLLAETVELLSRPPWAERYLASVASEGGSAGSSGGSLATPWREDGA